MKRFGLSALVLTAVTAALTLIGASLPRAQAPAPDSTIVPEQGHTTWAPGVRAGIPARPTICATVAASRFGDGASDASKAIQSAVNDCPEGETVALSAGTFLVSNFILIDKGITLRGAGPEQTRLVKTDGARAGTYLVTDAQPLIIVGPARWPKPDPDSAVDLTADAARGARTVVVKSSAGLAPGQIVLLDRDDYNAGAWLPLPVRLGSKAPASIWASDDVVFNRHNPPEGSDGAFPDSLTWFARANRPVNELKEIAAVDGTTITFTTPVHIPYTVAKRAQLTRYYRATIATCATPASKTWRVGRRQRQHPLRSGGLFVDEERREHVLVGRRGGHQQLVPGRDS